MNKLPGRFLVALAFFGAVGPLGIDMFLPGLPVLRDDLDSTPAAAQLTISGFMLGMAVGNLLFGAISDGTGRKRSIAAASLVFFLASVACALTPSMGVLIASRFLQGLAGGCVIVVSRAIIPDLVHGTAAARAFSALMALTGFMPAIAPAIGGLLLGSVGWRGIFWVLAALNLLQVIVALRLTETLPPDRRTTGTLSALFPRMWQCVKRPAFRGYMAAGSLGFGALFAYISASPLVLQSQLGFSATAYAFTFGAIALTLPASNVVNMRMVRKVAPRTLLVWALRIDALVAAALLIIAFVHPTAWMVALFAALAMMSGFISANASALAVEEVRDIGAGAGSGAMGFAQFVVAAVVPALVGVGSNHAASMALTSLACAGIAFVAVRVLSPAAPKASS